MKILSILWIMLHVFKVNER